MGRKVVLVIAVLIVVVSGMMIPIAACLTGASALATNLHSSIGVTGTVPSSPVPRSDGPLPPASSGTVSVNGVDPTTASLTWTESSDAFFSSYTLQYSTSGSNGPYSVLSTITEKTITSQTWTDLQPGTTYWWQIIDTDSFGSDTWNAYQQTQPALATLSASLTSGTTGQLQWNNYASYGGALSFGSYQVMEKVGAGSYASYSTIDAPGTTSLALSGLSPGVSYSFYVITTDDCSGCSPSTIPMETAPAGFIVPAALFVSAPSASPSSVTVGSSVTFSTSASGGSGGYSYSWKGLPTNCNNIDSSSVTCDPSVAGTWSVTVTVTDSDGDSVTSSPTTFTVSSPPSTVGGVPTNTFYLIVGVVISAVVVVVVLVAVLLLRRRPPANAVPPSPPLPPSQP